MKKHFTYLLLILAVFAACKGNKTKVSEDDLKKNLKGHTVLKAFSDTLLQDTFKVVLKGQKPADMIMNFSITAHDGAKIYQKDFKATELLKNYASTLDLKKQAKQLEFMQQELKLFLDEENFLEPAVTENENADANTPDKDFYNELKRSGLNGFKYRLSNETEVYIAWSTQKKQVLPYYSCCK